MKKTAEALASSSSSSNGPLSHSPSSPPSSPSPSQQQQEVPKPPSSSVTVDVLRQLVVARVREASLAALKERAAKTEAELAKAGNEAAAWDEDSESASAAAAAVQSQKKKGNSSGNGGGGGGGKKKKKKKQGEEEEVKEEEDTDNETPFAKVTRLHEELEVLRSPAAVDEVEAKCQAMVKPGVVMGEDELQALADVRGACVQVGLMDNTPCIHTTSSSSSSE
jgi:hypothetical protein